MRNMVLDGLMIALAVTLGFPSGTARGAEAPPARMVVDVKHDLVRLGVAETNVSGGGKTNDTPLLQAAVDFVAKRGGGMVIVPPGLYRVGGLEIKPGVEFTGAGTDRTVFRAWDRSRMFTVRGGGLRSFTAYGTSSEDRSGDKWIVGTKGRGVGSSAAASHIISISDTLGPVVVDHVNAYECRYDPLYVGTVDGLRVCHCRFDRAGRNVTSLVGNTRNFVFSHCYFGSLWGLYHVDLEHNAGKFIRNGAFVDCVFDGERAGAMNTDTWGRMLIFSGHEELENYNITVVGCTFKGIFVRVRGVFPSVRFLYNRWQDVPGGVFVRVRTNPTGDFRNAVVRGNRFFAEGGKPPAKLVHGVTFSGAGVFENNVPDALDGHPPQAAGTETTWREDHPAALEADDTPVVVKRDASTKGEVYLVRMPLGGHEFRFADRTVSKYGAGKGADVALHTDPFLALGKAGLRRLGSGRIEDYHAVPDGAWVRALWGVKPGDVIAVRTNTGKIAVLQILAMTPTDVSFRYRTLP